jgi:hypothetical protein
VSVFERFIPGEQPVPRQPRGRDPVAKAIVTAMVEAHPDWTDQQICDRINREYTNPLLTVEEVAQWRAEVAR